MATPRIRVVLVSRNERAWIGSCEKALREKGIDAVAAYSCWSAQAARELHEGEAVVIDGHLLCDFVAADKPGPVLALAPKQPVVIFNAQELDEQHRSAAMAHNAAMLDGNDVAEVADRVDEVLTPS